MVRNYDAEQVPAVYNRSTLPVTEKRPGVEQQYFRGLDTLIGFTRVQPGIEPQPHHHPWEQLNFVLEGECDFRVGDEVVTITEGDMFVIPPGVSHATESVSEVTTICFIGPLREDYARETAYQTEFERFDIESDRDHRQ